MKTAGPATVAMKLDGNEEVYRKAFRYWWQGFLAGGNEEIQIRQQPPRKPYDYSERRVEAGIMRALLKLSEPGTATPDNKNPPRELLKDSDLVFSLTMEQHGKLLKYVKQTLWSMPIIADVDDAVLLLESAVRE